MQKILEAIEAGAAGDEIASIPLPESYRAAFVRREDSAMFEGVASDDKDPRKSIHIGDVATPDLAPDDSPTGEAEIEIFAAPKYVEVENQGAEAVLAPGKALHWTVRWYARKLEEPAVVGSAALVAYVQNQIR